MKPTAHKRRILRLLERLRRELTFLYEEHHVKFPSKDMHEIELDVHSLMQEVERVKLINERKDYE